MDLKAHSHCDPFPTDWTTNHFMHDENFRHRPLDLKKDSIRLIKVLPDLSVNGLIICEIYHTTVKSKYQCLSYRWGSHKGPKTILIRDISNAESTEKRFEIGRSLYSFLNSVRGLGGAADPYWIDAICIDQQNGSERNHQVRQMGKIYSQARRVVVWLGNYPQDFEKLITDEGNKILCVELNRNEYWTRAWITQELVLPRRVDVLICRAWISFEELSSKLREHRLHGTFDLRLLRTKHHKRQILRWRKKPLLDTRTLVRARDAKCSISRDRIYSLLALVRRGDQLTVDYAMPALELVYNLLNLNANGWNVYAVLLALGLLKDELGDLSDSLASETPYIEYRVFFVNSPMDPRPEYIYADFKNWITRQLLSTKNIGCALTVQGDGYKMTRKTDQSLLLNVRVALSMLAKYVWETPDAIQRIEDVGAHAEFETWAKTHVPFYGLTSMIPSSRLKARNAFNKVRLGYGKVH